MRLHIGMSLEKYCLCSSSVTIFLHLCVCLSVCVCCLYDCLFVCLGVRMDNHWGHIPSTLVLSWRQLSHQISFEENPGEVNNQLHLSLNRTPCKHVPVCVCVCARQREGEREERKREIAWPQRRTQEVLLRAEREFFPLSVHCSRQSLVKRLCQAIA